ncbi:DMT family transporter [bacterium]|nr:MAG: DMT family transporter [bacterium]
MLFAAFMFSIMNVAVKKVSHIPSVEVVFFRAAISLIMSWLYLKRNSIPVFGTNHKVLFLRGLYGTIALIMVFATYQNMPLASAVVLHYLSLIFTAILASILLKERLFKIQYLFFALSFVGIYMIKGFDSRIETLYFVLGLMGAFFGGLAYTSIRKLKDSEHPLVIVFYFPLVALPVAGIGSFFVWVTPHGADWLWLLAVGVFTQIAQVYLTKAYQVEAAANVASANYIGIFYALGFGYFIFGETYQTNVILGMALVLVGVILNITFKRIKWIPKV